MLEERFYTRIKRGMVFWYNIDPSVNKFDVPELRLSDTKTAKDFLEYGDRPWLLVSVDERNVQGRTCTIVPLCTNTAAGKDQFHVPIRFKGKDALILCEHLMTVNCVELIKYDCTLEDKTMRMVEDAMRNYLGIHSDPLDGLASNEVIGKLEGIINEIVKKKVEEERAKITKVVDVDDAVIRIGEGLENLFGIASPKSTSVEEVEETPFDDVPDMPDTSDVSASSVEEYLGNIVAGNQKRKGRPSSKSTTKRVMHAWDRPSAISFIQEVDIKGADAVAFDYGYANGSSVKKTVNYLNRRFNLD